MFTPESFRTARWIRTVNLILQAVLLTTFFAGLNYLALHYSWRFDLTRNRAYSLSPETLSYLGNLRLPVHIVVAFSDSEDAQVSQDVRGLLREYVYAAQTNDPGKITVDYLDVFQRRREADALGIEQPNTILVTSGERRRVVQMSELYRKENGEKKAFQGEQVFTAAILDVSNPDKKKIYFLVGHGEMSTDDVDAKRGLSQLGDQLRQRNFRTEPLNLAYSRKVPDDAALLIITSPGYFQPFEQELLRQYVSTRAGRIILMLEPGKVHGLDDLLFDWGLIADDDVIFDTSPTSISEAGDLIIYHFARHPITQVLVDTNVSVEIGASRSIRINPARPADTGLNLTPLARANDTAWGERNYKQGPYQYTKGVDVPGSVCNVIVVSERVSAEKLPENLPFSVRGGRLVVFGTADFVTNHRINNPGNQTLFLNAVKWTVDRDTELNITPRVIQRFQLSLSQQQLSRLRLGLLFLLPGGAALLGLIVYWTRRS